uniref:Uncharacterized protein n=1 Tax=Kalanchoe fedtschenkoi TaxID=63787 RepID=A0A7N0ZYT1_KALFE
MKRRQGAGGTKEVRRWPWCEGCIKEYRINKLSEFMFAAMNCKVQETISRQRRGQKGA